MGPGAVKQRTLQVVIHDTDAAHQKALANLLSSLAIEHQQSSSSQDETTDACCSHADILILVLRESDVEVLSKVSLLAEAHASLKILLLRPELTPDSVIEALTAGADECAVIGDFENIRLVFQKLVARDFWSPLKAADSSLTQQRYNFSNIIAQSDAMKEIFETVKRLSQFNTTVLVTGESGTGKELLARALHHNSPRRGMPFVAVNCGAIPESLIESELFGHKRGSFTDAIKDKRGLFEEADGGTIFLDEIGELPLHLQVKILRTLQEQQIRRVGDEQTMRIDVRVIAATLRDLEQDVAAGRFRDDLFYRLNVVAIHLPPLRERIDDVRVLIDHFIRKHNRKLGTSIHTVQEQAMHALLQYHWKGNIRELENCIERALVLSESTEIDLQSLPPHIRNAAVSPRLRSAQSAGERNDDLSIKRRTRALETELIHRALEKTRGNRTHAAKILEISHRALLYKLKEFGLGEGE